MDKFAFVYQPWDLECFSDSLISEPALKNKNKRMVERIMRWLPPIRRKTVQVRSITGRVIEGEMIFVPLICEHIMYMDPNFIFQKTVAAARMAQELGVKIVGLGAYLAGVGRKGILVEKSLNVPLTTGTAYTISIAVDATLFAAEKVGIDLSNAKLTIIGATGGIGRAYACIMAKHVALIKLVARNRERLENLREEVQQRYNGCEVSLTDNISEAVRDSDIVMVATSTPGAIVNVDDLRDGSVVCDISVPHNISPETVKRRNILVIDGGLVKCPMPTDYHYIALLPNTAYACLSEVMILALEEKYESYSIGGDVSIDKVIQIKQWGVKHGFKLAEFKSFGRRVSEEQIDRVKQARKKILCS